MKLLHTADLHVDRPFEGLKNVPLSIKEKLQQVNQQVLSNIIDVAINEQVDLVVFAGDTFHQSRSSIRTQAFFMESLERLKQAEIPVIIAFGNHDYYQKQRYWFDFPDNVFLFDKEQVQTHYFMTKQQERIAVSGFSYEHQWLNKEMLAEFPMKDSTVDCQIGIYHGAASVEEQQNYAPFSLSEMKRKGYDYWALGHIHAPQIVSAHPLIVYPGAPQGHTKKEQSLKGVAIVQVQNGHSTMHFESVAEMKWQTNTYSLEKCSTVQEALSFLSESLFNEFENQTQLLFSRIYLTGVEAMGEEFMIAYNNGELLQYLQIALLNQTNQLCFIFELLLTDKISESKTLIPASSQLLTELEQTYLQPAIFADVLKELTQNPLFNTAITINETWREQSLSAADQVIKEDFNIQEESV